jgi:hypothetical protein
MYCMVCFKVQNYVFFHTHFIFDLNSQQITMLMWPCIVDIVKVKNQQDVTKYVVSLPQHVSGPKHAHHQEYN